MLTRQTRNLRHTPNQGWRGDRSDVGARSAKPLWANLAQAATFTLIVYACIFSSLPAQSDDAYDSKSSIESAFLAESRVPSFSAIAERLTAESHPQELPERTEPLALPAYSATATPQPGGSVSHLRSGEARSRTNEPSRARALEYPLPESLLADPEGLLPYADRTRLLEDFGLLQEESLLNPYEQSTIKGDRPVFGDDWYLSVGVDSETTFEAGRVASRADSSTQSLGIQRISSSLSLIRGMTTFRPPDWHFHLRTDAAFQSAQSLSTRIREGRASGDARSDVGLEELFVERHLRNLSDRYDFQSLRVGIQPFTSDFRGFLLNDHQPAVRWFGNASNNRLQYNVGWMRRLTKDPISGLNSNRLRDEDLIVANLYVQDVPTLGFQVQATALYHADDSDEDDARSTLEASPRPRADLETSRALAGSRTAESSQGHRVVYVGANGDGHFGRLNLSTSAYAALGRDRGGPVGSGTGRIGAYFAALEASLDFDWYRLKAYALLASGDSDPNDDRSQGFDFVRDRPVFAGLEDGFWQRESLSVSLGDAGGGLLLVSRDGLLPSLRSRGNRDTANFVNPGLRLAGLGADFDVLPELRLRLNATYMEFDDAAVIESLAGSRGVSRRLGEEVSATLVYRPWFINNVILRVSAGAFRPGASLRMLGPSLSLDDDAALYSARVRLTLSY